MVMATEAAETVHGLADVIENDETEIQQFLEVFELQKKIHETIEQQQALMKRDINILCSMVEKDKEKLAGDKASDVYLQKEKNVKQQMNMARQLKAQVMEECQAMREEMARCQKEEDRLAEERDEVENNTTRVLPNLRYDLNLYNMICRIRWQYDSSPDEVSGYVCNKKDVKPFSLSTKQNSEFFITNYLWDLIEEDVKSEDFMTSKNPRTR